MNELTIDLTGKLLQEKNHKAYATVLTLLWVLVMLAFSLDWQYHRVAFVTENGSPLEIAQAIASNGNSVSLGILDNIFNISANLVADTLLV